MENNYIAIVIITVLLNIVFILYVSGNQRIFKYQKSLFIKTSIVLVICSLSEFFVEYLNGKANIKYIQLLCKALELSSAPFVAWCLNCVLYGYKKTKTILVLSIINTILNVINIFTGFMYYVDESYNLVSTNLYFMTIAFYLVSAAYFIVCWIKFSLNYQNKNIRTLVAIIIFIIAGLSLHFFNNGINSDWLTISTAVFLFFIYYNGLVEQVDSLTGLLDRKSYNTCIESITEESMVVYIDVDDFKEINDTYGHDMGDKVLIKISELIKKAYGKYGLCYRIGGDEFCAILPGVHEIDKLNENLNYDINLEILNNKEIKFPTISIGYFYFIPNMMSIHEAIKEADVMLYDIKNAKKTSK